MAKTPLRVEITANVGGFADNPAPSTGKHGHDSGLRNGQSTVNERIVNSGVPLTLGLHA
jgi:hypothetical protein